VGGWVLAPLLAGSGAPGLLVDPRSAAELRNALERLLLSPDLRGGLAAEGKRHARHFRWERAAACSWEWFAKIART